VICQIDNKFHQTDKSEHVTAVKRSGDQGEESHYIYNGLGYLVANEWVMEKNAYGYTNNSNAAPNDRVNGVVVCDRHANSTGQGHINPTGKGHTTGGTTGGTFGGGP